VVVTATKMEIERHSEYPRRTGKQDVHKSASDISRHRQCGYLNKGYVTVGGE